MAIRKRTWESRGGVQEAWLVDYRDGDGKRRHKTFKRKKDAKDWAEETAVQVKKGLHVADSKTVTVKEAAEKWLATCEANVLERSTIAQYRNHLRNHIVPLIGQTKLSKVTVPFVREFEDRLRSQPVQTAKDAVPRKRSGVMIRRVVGSLGALLADAQERGEVAVNAVRALRGRRRRGSGAQDRHKEKPQVGVSIPRPDEVQRLLAAAAESSPQHKNEGTLGRGWYAFLLTAVLTGLRASELRGLRWEDLELKKAELHVRQRADQYKKMGRPKSGSGQRTIPLPQQVVHELSKWRLVCPKGPNGRLGLVFPNGAGNVEEHVNLAQRGLIPTMIAARITKPVLDEQGIPKRDEAGKPVVDAKYTGLHALRHFFASWCINRTANGGRELPAKVVQELLGHSSIVMTMDVYGHLFPRGDDRSELAAAAERLLGIA